jgi:UDP-2,4-diacetamido-2,4,6-trideoxy-beta-L-altropyranose hydrolase
MTRPGTLLIRADANAQMGTGHVMRCLALAQAWQASSGRALFALSTTTPALENRLRGEGADVTHLSAPPGSAHDAAKTVALGQEVGAAWVVLDGYQFDASYQQAIGEAGLRLLFIDDWGHASHYYADVVLNQNIHADESLYASREPHTRLLLGTRYVLLRREFWEWHDWERETPDVARKVLVTMGGTDPANVTLEVVNALHQIALDGLEVVVVIGGGNPHYEVLRTAIQGAPFPIRLARDVTNMPELMAWAEVAVSAGGSTCWELAFMGLPAVILVLAENQRPIAERLDARGIGINLGWGTDPPASHIAAALSELVYSRSHRQQAVLAGRALVDGSGGRRVADALR